MTTCQLKRFRFVKLIFEQSLKNNNFPETWKVANVVPVHKNEDESVVRNYYPISLIPILC